MVEIRSIELSNLLVDTQNPRLEDILENQNDTLRAIARNQDRKLLVLAKDILEHGLNPMELLLVMPTQDGEFYIVLEGNRRVTALKILENPEIIRGAIDESLYKYFKRLSVEYQKNPIETIDCVVVSSREEADHWIELRHTGENQGAGIVAWGAHEIERFKKRRRGVKSPELQILDFLEKRGYISPEIRNKVPITNLRRLINTPYVRDKLGISIKNGEVITNLPELEIVKGLKKVIEDLASEKIKVSNIYYAEDRKKYIDSIKENLPDKSKAFSEFFPLDESPREFKKEKEPSALSIKSQPSRRRRSTLIPIRGFSLNIDQPRINEIYRELRMLKIEDFINAVAVLFRVFLELSVDEYIKRNNIPIDISDPRNTLSYKIQEVANHLKSKGILNDQQLKPVRRAAQKDSFLGTTITTMHQYIHNQYFHPAPSDLIATWDNLEPFFVAIWNRK